MKQVAFVEWYCSAEVRCNGTAAARRAGYNGSAATLGVVATENLRKPLVRAEIDKRMNAALKGAQITVKKVLEDIESIRKSAMADRKYGAALRCCELQGKYLGMWRGRNEHSGTLETATTDELIDLLQEITAAGGIDLGELVRKGQQ